MTVLPLELGHRAWQNLHQQRLKERMASCNKCSINRCNSYCYSMPVLASCRRPAPPTRMPGNCGPLLTCPETSWEMCLADAASWGRGCWCLFGPEISRWAWAAAGRGRPRMGTWGQAAELWASLQLPCGRKLIRGSVYRGNGAGTRGCGLLLSSPLLPPEASEALQIPFREGTSETVSFLLPLPVLC